MPAKIGTPAEVPPTTSSVVSVKRKPLTQSPFEQMRYPSWSTDALTEMSGTSRLASLGTPTPTCQLGLANCVLAPPPLAARLPPLAISNAVSFHEVSGM